MMFFNYRWLIHLQKLNKVNRSYSRFIKVDFQFKMASDSHSERTLVIVNCILNVPLILICIVGNALVLIATSKSHWIGSSSIEILSSFAFSDLLVGIIAQPLFLAHQLMKESFLNNLMVLIVYPVCGVSLWTVTAISIDRFLALHFHMRYATLVTTTRVKISIVFIWLYNFVSSALYYLVPFIYFFIMTLTTVTCILTCFLAYLRIFFIVRHHQLQIHAQQQTLESKDAAGNVNGVSMARLKNIAINTFVFFIFFVICYLPMYALLTFAISKRAQWTTEYDFSITAVFLNSAINPFIFCWRLQELRRNVLKTLRTIFWKQTLT